MKKVQICNKHDQEEVKFIGRDITNNELTGFCVQCVPTANVPLILVEDFLKNIENNKTLMINHLMQKKEDNKDILNRLIDFLSKKNELIMEVIQTIKYELDRIEKFYNFSINQIEDYPEINIDYLVSFFSEQDSKNQIQETREKVMKLLEPIESSSITFETWQIFNTIPLLRYLDLSKTQNSNYYQKVYVCEKHKLKLIGLGLNQFQDVNDNLICPNCQFSNSRQLITVEDADKIWRDHQSNLFQYYSNVQTQLNETITRTLDFIKQKNFRVNKTLSELTLKIEKYQLVYQSKILKNFHALLKNYGIDYKSDQCLGSFVQINTFSKLNLQILQDDLKNFGRLIQKKFSPQTRSFFFTTLNQFLNLVQNYQIDSKQLLQFSQFPIFEYKTDISYCIIAINPLKTIVVVGFFQMIAIFDFNQGSLNFVHQFNGNSDDLISLQFMKKKNCFISASQSELMIWIYKEDQTWITQQTLKNRNGRINCFVINQNGDLIITGCSNRQIRFWKFQNQQWRNSITLEKHSESVSCLSLNESEDILISCSLDKKILILKIKDGDWSTVQVINSDQNVYQLCFISNEEFVFQQVRYNNLVYKFDKASEQFKSSQNILLPKKNKFQNSNLQFPIQFIKSKQILLIKYQGEVYLFKRQKNQFIIQKIIKFCTNQLFGILSDDGEFLITWDYISQEIQVRRIIDLIGIQEEQLKKFNFEYYQKFLT